MMTVVTALATAEAAVVLSTGCGGTVGSSSDSGDNAVSVDVLSVLQYSNSHSNTAAG
jgi:hypothetical protein